MRGVGIDHSCRRWWRCRRQLVAGAAQAGRRERSGSRPCRDGCGPRCQGDGPSAPPPAARLDPIELNSALTAPDRPATTRSARHNIRMSKQPTEPSQEAESYLLAAHEDFVNRRSEVVQKSVEIALLAAITHITHKLVDAQEGMKRDGYNVTDRELLAGVEESLRRWPILEDPLWSLREHRNARHELKLETTSFFAWLEQAIAAGIIGQVGYEALKRSVKLSRIWLRKRYVSKLDRQIFGFELSHHAATYLTDLVFRAISDQCKRHELPIPSGQSLAIERWNQTEIGSVVAVKCKDDDSFNAVVEFPADLKPDTQIRVTIRSAASEQVIKNRNKEEVVRALGRLENLHSITLGMVPSGDQLRREIFEKIWH